MSELLRRARLIACATCLLGMPIGPSSAGEVEAEATAQERSPRANAQETPESSRSSTTPAAARGRVHLDLGLRLGGQSFNQDDDYDDIMTAGGVQFEIHDLTGGRSMLYSIVLETGTTKGQPIDDAGRPDPFGVRPEMTYTPLHATFAWAFRPDEPVHGFVGGGPSFVMWEIETPNDSNKRETLGGHVAAGVRWSTDSRLVTLGAEVRRSFVPASEGFLELDDFGASSLTLSVLLRLR